MKRTIIYLQDTSGTQEEEFRELQLLLNNRLRQEDLEGRVQAVRVADIGVYDEGIVACVEPGSIYYRGLSAGDACRVIDETVLKGAVLEDRVFTPRRMQERIVLRNCGIIDPADLAEYEARGGYRALKKVVAGDSAAVIDELKAAGLRGRGGAGFPTWLKWRFTREAAGDRKYIICNGDEGDPGAYMDRSILEGDPHAVLEGLIIGGLAVGAEHGYFYIRAEYPLAIERIGKALEQARERGLLGGDVLGSGRAFNAEIRLGAGAFVCGEETSLIASLEGRRGTPRPRPPYPSVSGLWGCPTVINNVETLANIPAVIDRGGAWFAGFGTAKSPGTKVFALTGKVRNSGLIEVPMGLPLKDIVYDIGGGPLDKRRQIKAVQTGGPSGGVIPADRFDTPVDYENLLSLGSIMGSGGMIVMDDSDCMVDIARFYIKFCVDESCGKCAPCRYGTYLMLDILDRIATGRAKLPDLDRLRQLAEATGKASLCGLGQTSANPVLSTLRYFEDEYREHIRQKKCRACRCPDLITYWISQHQCTRCGMCFRICPVGAISGNRDRGYYIQLDKCIKCGQCKDVCKFDAVSRE